MICYLSASYSSGAPRHLPYLRVGAEYQHFIFVELTLIIILNFKYNLLNFPCVSTVKSVLSLPHEVANHAVADHDAITREHIAVAVKHTQVARSDVPLCLAGEMHPRLVTEVLA